LPLIANRNMSPVNIDELTPEVRARVLKQIGEAEGAANPTQISNLDISNRAALIARLMELHKGINQAYALRDTQRLEAGKILLSLRKAAPHGEWETQLQELCKAVGMSRSTAHNYMNAAEKGAVPKPKDGDTSVVTSKAANGGHFKTGQRMWAGTRWFYANFSCSGKPVFVRQLRGPHLRT